MKLKLDQIEKICYLLNHLNSNRINVRCDKLGRRMEITAWTSDKKKIARIIEKTGIQPVRADNVIDCVFTKWVI